MSQRVPPPARVEYPSSDGRPMAENDAQRAAIMYAIGALELRFAGRPDVYVSGDLLIYYQEGDPRASVAPDAFVVFGAQHRRRMTYKLWEEPKAPDFVLEVASASTWRDDDGPKREIYERLGVSEYWQYDPTGEHLGVRLKGWRLVGGAYEAQPVVASLDGTRFLRSETLGLDLRARDEEMYFVDSETGERLRSHAEDRAASIAAEARAETARGQGGDRGGPGGRRRGQGGRRRVPGGDRGDRKEGRGGCKTGRRIPGGGRRGQGEKRAGADCGARSAASREGRRAGFRARRSLVARARLSRPRPPPVARNAANRHPWPRLHPARAREIPPTANMRPEQVLRRTCASRVRNGNPALTPILPATRRGAECGPDRGEFLRRSGGSEYAGSPRGGSCCAPEIRVGAQGWSCYRRRGVGSVRMPPAVSRCSPMSQRVPPPARVEYPSSDGRPMAENDAQRAAIMYAIGALELRFAGRPDVYVSGDLLIYYQEGDPRASVAPDAFVVFGAQHRRRMTYKLWEEPKAPDFVLEVASASTWRDDDGPKREIYARLGVSEYWQYDPTGEHLGVRLKGWRLVGSSYEAQPVVASLDGTRFLRSETLGLDLRARDEEMYFVDSETGERLRSHAEDRAASIAAEARADDAEARAETAEAEKKAEAAARRAAESRAEAAEARARDAQAQIAELEARLRGKDDAQGSGRADRS